LTDPGSERARDRTAQTGAPRTGVVYLVGAGPGDPGLLTVRAVELIASADVILYDRLIPPEALRHARADQVHDPAHAAIASASRSRSAAPASAMRRASSRPPSS